MTESKNGYKFEVQGLPAGQSAYIVHFGQNWRFMRTVGNVLHKWTGRYPTPEAALEGLQKQMDSEHTRHEKEEGYVLAPSKIPQLAVAIYVAT